MEFDDLISKLEEEINHSLRDLDDVLDYEHLMQDSSYCHHLAYAITEILKEYYVQ